MNKIDKHFMRIALDAMPPKPMSDEEAWRTSEEGKHYKIETETGEIKAGFGGKFNGQKVDPSKKGSSKSSSASAPKASASPKPKAAKPAKQEVKASAPTKSNYIVKNDGPSWKNEGLKAAREGKKPIDESVLRDIKAGSDRKFTVIEPAVQPPNAPRSVGLYSKRDPYGFRVITGARMTKGNTPGSQYVFEDNAGNKIRFGSLYGDSVSVYEE